MKFVSYAFHGRQNVLQFLCNLNYAHSALEKKYHYPTLPHYITTISPTFSSLEIDPIIQNHNTFALLGGKTFNHPLNTTQSINVE